MTITKSEAARFFIVAQDKGGVGKSFVASLLADTALRSGMTLRIFSNDPPGLIKAYGDVEMIELAATDAAQDDAYLDIDAHSPLLEAIDWLGDDPTGVVIYDTGASTVNRFADISKLLNFDERLCDAGVKAAVLVPVTADLDVARGALITFDALTDAFPSHLHIAVASLRDGVPKLLASDHPYHQALAAAPDGVIQLPAFHRDMALLVNRAGLPISRLTDNKDKAMFDDLMGRVGISLGRAELLSSKCALLIDGFDKALRPLVSWPRR